MKGDSVAAIQGAPHFGWGLSQLVPLRENVRLALRAEAGGFHRVSCADNLFMRPVWPILTLVAEHTRRVEVGALVTHPFLTHPAVIAGYAAEVDEISDGRAFLGIGRGAFYDQVGLDPQKPVAAVRESLEVIGRLLRGERDGYKGEVFTLAPGAGLRWRPPRTAMPIVIGSWGPKLAELTGEVGHEVDVGFLLNLEHIAMVRDHLHLGARRAGRDPAEVKVSCGSFTSVAADRAAALAFARHHLSLFLPVLARIPAFPRVDPAELQAVESALKRGGPADAARHVGDATVEAFCLVGTPRDVIARIERLVGSGVGHVTFCPPHGPDPDESLRLIASEVLPHFHAP
jgi:5,10-methylenetetrahydromethanopterin reductase